MSNIFEGGRLCIRLKELQKERGISQFMLAMDLELNQSISQYETCKREADDTAFICLTDYFRVFIDFMRGKNRLSRDE